MARKYYDRDLSDFKEDKITVVNADGSKEEVESPSHHWLQRASEMKIRREHFENIWRDGLFSFVAFAVQGDQSERLSFDPDTAPELQGYYNSKYATYGFKFTDMRYPLEFAVVMRKLAAEIKNLPTPDWRIPGADDQSPAKLWKSVYAQAMDEAEADYEDFETMLQKNIFGSAIRWSRMVSFENTIQEPSVSDDGQVTYTKKTHQVREFRTTTMDLRHVLLDDGCTMSSLGDCEDAIVTEYYTEDRAKKEFSDVDFDALGIKAMPKKQLFQDINELNGGDAKSFYEAMNCYNEITDTYDVMLNGVTVRRSPIPMRSFRGKKKIPLALIIDNKIPGQPYGYGEPAVIKAFREIKNKNRNLIYDVTKKGAKPTLAVDPLSTFSEETYTFGQDFVRVAPNDMAPIPIVSNLDAPLRLDEMTDNDVTMVSGINIKDTTSPPSDETATKTVVRKESQVALVDLGLYLNTVAGLKRLHRINANILRLHLRAPQFGNKDGVKQVTTEGSKLFRSRNEKTPTAFIEEEAQGSHTFEYKGEDIDHDFEPILNVGNIAISDQLEKNMKMETVEQMTTLTPDAVDPFGMAEYLRSLSDLPKTVLKQREEPQQAVQPEMETEDDKIASLLKKSGAIIPEDQKVIQDFKDAKKNQIMAEGATSPEGMGGEGAPPSV